MPCSKIICTKNINANLFEILCPFPFTALYHLRVFCMHKKIKEFEICGILPIESTSGLMIVSSVILRWKVKRSCCPYYLSTLSAVLISCLSECFTCRWWTGSWRLHYVSSVQRCNKIWKRNPPKGILRSDYCGKRLGIRVFLHQKDIIYFYITWSCKNFHQVFIGFSILKGATIYIRLNG